LLAERRSCSAYRCCLFFLCLAALYESWSNPFAAMLAVQLGLIGSVAAAWLRRLPSDVFFTVGIVTIIGQSGKNAILMIEFAKNLRAHGIPSSKRPSQRPNFASGRSS
jgi:multidrug efflux pump subunit AcrB